MRDIRNRLLPGPEIDRPRIAIGAALCVAEAALVWLIVTALFAVPADRPDAVPGWFVLALIVGTAVLPNVLDTLDIWNPWYELSMAAMVVGSLLVACKLLAYPAWPWINEAWLRDALRALILRPTDSELPVWGIVALVAYAWWRGRMRAAPSIDSANLMLRAGVLVALIGAVLLATLDGGSAAGASDTAVVVFFVATMIAIGLARLFSPEWRGRDHAARTIVAAILPSILAAVLAIVIAGVVSREVLDTILWAVGPLLWALGIVFRAAVFAIAIATVVVLSPVLYLLSGRTVEIGPIRIDTSATFGNRIQEETAERTNQVPDAIRYLIAAALLAVIFAGVTRFVLRRRTVPNRGNASEERETVRPVLDIAAWLASLMRTLGLTGGRAQIDPLAGLRGDARWNATVRIRDNYARLLIWSADRGHPRMADVTPREHAKHLTAATPGIGAREDLALVTAIYDRTRYDGQPASDADAESVQTAFNRLTAPRRTTR